VSQSEEIEVEVVEVESHRPLSRSPGSSPEADASPGWSRMPPRVFQLPKWLLPILIVLGLIVLLVALLLFVVIGIPWLIIRGILRLLR